MPVIVSGMVDEIAFGARKGRGAVTNRSGRFEGLSRHDVDDGWSGADEAPQKLRTTVTIDSTRTIIARNKSPDVPFDRSINPYRGCEHGCIYCFARPTHAYLGLSPGLDFESRLFAKPDAAALLDNELRKKGYSPDVIAMGTNTDPYQPIEREMKITRSILEVLRDHRHPVGIVTKSTLVLRDLDILGPMAAQGLAQVCVSVTSLDRELSRKLEPRATTPPRRLETLRALSEAGIRTGVMAAPMIPALNDPEIEAILEAARAAGARFAAYILLRLPLEIADLFEEWLRSHYPDRADRVLNHVRGARGGKAYEATFGTRMRGTGNYAELLSNRFKLAVKRLGFEQERSGLDVSQFRPPPRAGDQLPLF